MKGLRSLTTGVLVAGLAAVGAAAYAQGPGPGGPGGPGGRRGPMMMGPAADLPLRALNLTDAQRQQVRQIGEQHRSNLQSAGDELQQAMEAQRAAVETLPVDESAIRGTAEALAAAQTHLAIEHAQMRSEIVALLTPEQQDQLKQLQAERDARLKQRQDRMRQRRQPR